MPISAQMRTVLLNFGLLALASLLLANLGQSQRVDRRKKKSLQVEPEDQRQQLVPDGADGPRQMPFCELEMMTLDQKLALKQHVKKLIIRNRNRHHHKLFRFTRATVGEGAKIWNKLPSKSGKQFFYVVPWMLASHYDDEDFRPVLEAMDLIQSSTCIRFDHVNNMEKKQIYNGEDYLEIVNEPGCHSVIGRHSGKNLLQLELGPKIENPLTGRWTRRTCMKRRIVLHEMLHLLGLFHEHQRSDRDKFVQIDITNVQHGKRNNYVKQKNDQTWGFPFNFESIMNYRQNAFAINPKKLTIRIINGSNQCQLGMGMHEHASELDLLLVNLLYNCPGVERHIDEFIDRHFFSAGSKAHHHQHHHHQETKQMERLLGNVVKEWTQNAAWSNHHSAAVVGHNSGARHHQKQHQQKGKGGGGKQGNGKQMAAPKHHQQRQKLQHHVNRSGAGAKRNGKGSRWRRR